MESISATVDSDTQVIVIDDESSDDRVVPFIESVIRAGGPRWRFVRQPRNLGFVATANLGMRLAQTDVILLNSDTEVTPGWLAGMAACLASDDRIGTATPWSNNGEIVSIPEFCKANPAPQSAAAIARCIAGFSQHRDLERYPELPTAVGFCMAISRKAIEEVGLFDSAHFGLGYGEENDFSLRASQSGFRNVLCDDVYVVHHGGRSFGPLGLAPDEGSMERLLQRHPRYREQIEAFITADPLSARRQEICAAVVEAGIGFD